MTTIINYPNSLIEEFETVDLLLYSQSLTGRTDAFIVAWIKREKQVRRIFIYLIYQYPAFSRKDVKGILNVIASKPDLYFEGFVKGFDALYSKTFQEIVGDHFDRLHSELARTENYRNKILHGQPTGKSLTAGQLTDEVNLIRDWCAFVSVGMATEIGYDGFTRNSFRKSATRNFSNRYKVKIADINELNTFIDRHMRRRMRVRRNAAGDE